MAESKNELDIAFQEFEQEVGANKVIRKEMIENLRKVALSEEMKISPYDKSMLIQSKLMIFKTLDDLLKSDEDVTVKKIKMKLSRKNDETNGMVGATIIQLLKNIRADGDEALAAAKPQDQTAALDEITKRAEEIKAGGDAKLAKQLEVSEGELEVCDKIASDAKRPEDEPKED